MDKRGRVKLSFYPTEKNKLILQNMGFLNKRGQSTGRLNLNDFLNRALDEKIGIDDKSKNGELLEKVIVSEIQCIQKKRDDECVKVEGRLKELAMRLAELRGQKKVRDYEGPDDGQGRSETGKVYKREELRPEKDDGHLREEPLEVIR